MGIWPTLRGNEMGSLPLGSTLPNRRSATASPPLVPGYQASNSAGDWAAATAAPNPEVSVQLVSQPGTYVTCALGAAALTPSSTVVIWSVVFKALSLVS